MRTDAPVDRERGLALIVVLWFLTAMTAMALGFTTLSRAETRRSHNLVEAVRARAVLAAALERTVEELREDAAAWRTDGTAERWTFDGAEVAVRIEGESGKLDLNAADEQLVLGLMRALGLAEERAAELSDALLDWRDDNQLRRLHGAEERDYASAGRQHGPADGPFAHIAELRALLPMDPPTYGRLEPLVTVHTGLTQPDSTMAGRELRKALIGVVGEQEERKASADEATAMRMESSWRSGAAAGEPPPQAASYARDPRGLYTVRLDVRLPGGYLGHADAVIWVADGEGQRLHRVLDWNPAPLRSEEAR